MAETDDKQTPTLEDAIDSAIAQASPNPPANNEENDTDGSAQETDTGTGGDAGGEAEGGTGDDAGDTPGDGSEGAGAAATGKGGAEGEGDAKGKDGADPAAAGGDAAAKGAAKTGDDRATGGSPDGAKGKDDKPKGPDPVNDPIPDDVKGKTRARMTSLIDTAKTLTTERDEAVGQVDGFLKAIAETGADPEGFARHVEVLRLMNSEKPEDRRSALKFLRGAATKLAADLGEREPGKELEGHADLLEDVENGDLSRERAIEIANGRNAKAAADEAAKRNTKASEEELEQKRAIEAGKTALNELEAQLRKSDPLYDRKYAAIKNAALALIPTIHPSQWVASFKRLYNSVDAKNLPRPTPRVGDGGNRNVPRGTGAQQPMRPRQGAGGGGPKVPQSVDEAINFGIEQANARR